MWFIVLFPFLCLSLEVDKLLRNVIWSFQSVMFLTVQIPSGNTFHVRCSSDLWNHFSTIYSHCRLLRLVHVSRATSERLGSCFVHFSSCEALVCFVLHYYVTDQVVEGMKAHTLRHGRFVGTKKPHSLRRGRVVEAENSRVRRGRLIRFADYRCCRSYLCFQDIYYSIKSASACLEFVVRRLLFSFIECFKYFCLIYSHTVNCDEFDL